MSFAEHKKTDDTKISFLGAAGEVTGSCYLVEGQGVKFLVDCGMFQGDRYADDKNRARFTFQPADIDFVILTHAHIDHSGLIPKLCRDGFKGAVYSTRATSDLLEIMLRDSAYIHEKEAERFSRKRNARKKTKVPLYTMADAEKAILQIVARPYDEVFAPCESVKVRMREAGHILGSAILEIWVGDKNHECKIVFSGDLGQPGRPILRDPHMIEDADYLVVESTYGDRQHKALSPSLDELVEAIENTVVSGKGNIIVPAFAVGRTQELIYYLYHLTYLGRVKNLSVFLDSPMAQRVTNLTSRHFELFDKEAKKLTTWQSHSGHDLTLTFTRTVQESMALNSINSGAIIISASGMCTAGRILHHLKHGLGNRNNTVLITGYQAHGTVGRRLVDGATSVKIFGRQVPVNASVITIGGFSAHADQNAIMDWLENFKTPPGKTFITHGEPYAASALMEKIEHKLGWTTHIPVIGEQILIN